MKSSWRTAWQGHEIVVFRDDLEVDRLQADQIERVVLVHRGSGESPGDLVYALVEVGSDCLLFPAATGFGGRVNFERQAFWAERGCVYWLSETRASLPLRLRRSAWFLPFGALTYRRVPHAEMAPLLDRWPVKGPQTWEQRKWKRIEGKRPFAPDESRVRA